jgi:VWFA-related protein
MRLLRAIGLLAIAGALCAQDATFSADVKVVNLLATVRDRDGKVVKDLTRDDFVIEEDGRPQPIRYFTRESDLPLTVGLLVDTSRSMQTVFEPERIATVKFLDQVLREDRDLAFVMHFDIGVGVLQGFTSSKEKLASALAKLKIPKIPSTLLYDAIAKASTDLMKTQSGRKAFILLSDGMDVRSHTSIGTAIEYAQRADTIIYTILFSHRMGRPGRGGAAGAKGKAARNRQQQKGPRVIQRLARETGGGYFAVSEDHPIYKIYAQIEEDLRNQYSIGYTPDRAAGDKNFRKITLTAKRQDLVVRTRAGYYPK